MDQATRDNWANATNGWITVTPYLTTGKPATITMNARMPYYTGDLIADFGPVKTNAPYGLWRLSNNEWVSMNTLNADSFMLSPLNGASYDVVADFGASGLQRFSASTGKWATLKAANSESFMLSERYDNGSYDVISDFGAAGFQRYSNGAWTTLKALNADSFMLSGRYANKYDIVADFGASGFWRYSNGAWQPQLSASNVEQFLLSGRRSDGSYDVIADFGTSGLFRYTSGWESLSPGNAESFMMTSLYSDAYDIITDFGTGGLLKSSSSDPDAWTTVSGMNAESYRATERRTDGSYDIVVDFGANGLYFYSNNVLSKINSANIEAFRLTEMYNGNYDIIADFGVNGLWKSPSYDPSTWTRLTESNATTFSVTENVIGNNYSIIADFQGSGLFRYSNGGWARLSYYDPEPEVSQRLAVQNKVATPGYAAPAGYTFTTALADDPTKQYKTP
jgi:hypothetical protein